MSSKSTVATMFGAVLVFALGASPAAYAAPPKDACTLLTAAQVSAALGVSVETGKTADKSICEWSQQGAALGKAVLLTILEPIGNLTPVDRFNAAKMPCQLKASRKLRSAVLGTTLCTAATSFALR